jgi:hypothetical protein
VRGATRIEDGDVTGEERGIEQEGSEHPMTKWERRQFFDRLVQLRALYRLRGPDDSEVELSIAAAIELGEQLMSDTPSADVDGHGVPAPGTVRRGR